MTTLDEFFSGEEISLKIYENLCKTIGTFGVIDVKVTKSQISFRRKKAFAWAWIPGKYLHGKTVPLVLSVALGLKDASPRWKEVIEPKTGRYMHHLESFSGEDIDDEVHAWLKKSMEAAE